MERVERPHLRNLGPDTANAILEQLTAKQHLKPHEPLSSVLADTVEALGCCPVAVERAMQWLSLDGSTSVGRLRRTELMQLARSVARFWQQSVDAADADAQ